MNLRINKKNNPKNFDEEGLKNNFMANIPI